MKWIKASEQTPKEIGIYFAKWKNTNGKTGKTLLDWDGDIFQPMCDNKLTEIEWLDEDETADAEQYYNETYKSE